MVHALHSPINFVVTHSAYCIATTSKCTYILLIALYCISNMQSDCSCALLIEPTHVKSLLRRSTAYNAVGKHRAALRDLLAAAALEPTK